jgi:hypothetical protein
LPGLTVHGLRIKIKPIEGTWRVILPITIACWIDVARIQHASYDEAFAAAKAWARAIERDKASPKSNAKTLQRSRLPEAVA